MPDVAEVYIASQLAVLEGGKTHPTLKSDPGPSDIRNSSALNPTLNLTHCLIGCVGAQEETNPQEALDPSAQGEADHNGGVLEGDCDSDRGKGKGGRAGKGAIRGVNGSRARAEPWYGLGGIWGDGILGSGADKDTQFEIMYGISRLSQAPPSSPKGGARPRDMLELRFEVSVVWCGCLRPVLIRV